VSTRAAGIISLVALLISLALVLLPGSKGEIIDSGEINHFYTNQENNLTVVINNPFAGETEFSLSAELQSHDLQQPVLLPQPNLQFTLAESESDNYDIPFQSHYSGDYSFYISLVMNFDNQLQTIEKSWNFTFYDHLTVIPGISDQVTFTGGAAWSLDGQEFVLQPNDNSRVGLVFGPIDSSVYSESVLEINHVYSLATDAEFSISYSTDFDSLDKRYTATWHELTALSPGSFDGSTTLLLPPAERCFIQFEAVIGEPEINPTWQLNWADVQGVTPKHELDVSFPDVSFLAYSSENGVGVELYNSGLFTQYLGNISASLNVKWQGETIASLQQSLYLPAGETRQLNFVPALSEPGIYECQLEIKVLDRWSRAQTCHLLYSREQYVLPENGLSLEQELALSFEAAAILFEGGLQHNGEMLDSWSEDGGQIQHLTAGSEPLTLGGGESVVVRAIASLDIHRFDATSLEPVQELVPGWEGATIEFVSGEDETLSLQIVNKGFDTEIFSLQYFYAPNFLMQLEGVSEITLLVDETQTIDLMLTPQSEAPHEGGSQFTVLLEQLSTGESVTLNHVLTYRASEIVVDELHFNRNGVLLGQTVEGSIEISNQGYPVSELTLELWLTAADDSRELLASQPVNRLENGESMHFDFEHSPVIVGLHTLEVELKGGATLINDQDAQFRAVALEMAAEPEAETSLPLRSTAVAAGIIGILSTAYYFSKSENLRYHSFKLLLPLYTRLQRDRLADHPTRQNLMQYIYGHPGANLTQLRERFGLHNGVLSHHISILEGNQVIQSLRSGRQRLFYPSGFTGLAQELLITNEVQQRILEEIKTSPGVTQSMIATRLGMSRQKVNYHVTALERKSALRVEKSGRISRLYLLRFR
jgi:hypothetical protein